MKKNFKKIEDWGIGFSCDVEYSPSGRCGRCRIIFSEFDIWKKHMVGFRKKTPLKGERLRNIGGIIISCPNCQKLYWFHITESNFWLLKNQELWPKKTKRLNKIGGKNERSKNHD